MNATRNALRRMRGRLWFHWQKNCFLCSTNVPTRGTMQWYACLVPVPPENQAWRYLDTNAYPVVHVGLEECRSSVLWAVKITVDRFEADVASKDACSDLQYTPVNSSILQYTPVIWMVKRLRTISIPNQLCRYIVLLLHIKNLWCYHEHIKNLCQDLLSPNQIVSWRPEKYSGWGQVLNVAQKIFYEHVEIWHSIFQ